MDPIRLETGQKERSPATLQLIRAPDGNIRSEQYAVNEMERDMIRVMIVAKHSEVREGLSIVLRLAGEVEVTGTAASLVEATQMACAAEPDVVLIDLEMPEGEGCATIRQLARLCRGTKIIALTSHDYPAARAGALEAGANMVMVKGLDVHAIVAGIQHLCMPGNR
jgi:two-component system, NarL family, response regulator DevR